MISQKSEFEFIHRGFKDTIVLVPGWATDYRIFSRLDLDYNYLLPVKSYPFNFKGELLRKLDQIGMGKISLLGWSLGGFLASEFALKKKKKVNELILVSICSRFNFVELEGIRRKLAKNRKAYLYKFYSDCFSGNTEGDYAWFKDTLLKSYLDGMGLEYLDSGLDYFLRQHIDAASLRPIKKVRVFHGVKDRIIPLKEAEDIKGKLPKTEFIFMAETGHLPFLHPDFKKEIANG